MARFVTQSAHAGVTAIDNAFIIDYMPTAPDGAVKAYIYGLMAAGRGDAPDIADALGMDDAQLCDAFAYWQRLGLVRIASGEPLIVEFLKTESIAPAERTRLSAICDWIEVFGFSEETAALVVSDCARRRGSKVKLWQMNAEAKAWADANVSTIESALEYIAKRDERIAGAQKILSRWKLRRAATEDELALYTKWKEEWGMSDEVISLALGELTSAAQPSFKYLDTVLSTFRSNGAVTPEAIAALRRERDASRELARMMLARAGINRAPTAAQQDDADMWRTRMNIAPELLLLCAESCRASDKPWATIKRTVERWHAQGISDLDSARQDIEQHANSAAKLRSRGRALSHASRTYTDQDLSAMGVELLE